MYCVFQGNSPMKLQVRLHKTSITTGSKVTPELAVNLKEYE